VPGPLFARGREERKGTSQAWLQPEGAIGNRADIARPPALLQS